MMESIMLSNGIQMPILGYGVDNLPEDACQSCVLDALKAGYRSIDTSQAKGHEALVGRAVSNSGFYRNDIFLTSKVSVDHYGYETCKRSIFSSLEKLKTDYIDLMLLDKPFSDYYGAWKAMEDLYEQGIIRSIGVSHFDTERLVDLSSLCRIAPMVNQLNTYVFNQKNETIKWMKKYGIQHITEVSFDAKPSPTSVLKDIAASHQKTKMQVLLRWHIERHTSVIVKTNQYPKMVQNRQVFDFSLSEEEMREIASLDENAVLSPYPDPQTVEMIANFIHYKN